VGDLRDYAAWHRRYDDPLSGLSWRLGIVQGYLGLALSERQGPIDVLSLCSGDGRDILQVLASRPDDAARSQVTLVELDEGIAQEARNAARAAGLVDVQVRMADAGNSDACVGVAPADIVLMVGIFGNISDQDLERTIVTAPQLCKPGATLIWSRGRDLTDRNATVRRWFADAGFTETDYRESESSGRPALGNMRYVGPSQPLIPGQRLFTFQR
jgi:hypothetical protein